MVNSKYKWDGDSRDERHSEFVHSGCATTTAGVFHSTWAQHRVKRARSHCVATALRPLLVTLAVSGLLLYAAIGHLPG